MVSLGEGGENHFPAEPVTRMLLDLASRQHSAVLTDVSSGLFPQPQPPKEGSCPALNAGASCRTVLSTRGIIKSARRFPRAGLEGTWLFGYRSSGLLKTCKNINSLDLSP